MEEMILIPKSRYFKMLESFDKVVEELKNMKKVLKEGETIDDKENSSRIN